MAPGLLVSRVRSCSPPGRDVSSRGLCFFGRCTVLWLSSGVLTSVSSYCSAACWCLRYFFIGVLIVTTLLARSRPLVQPESGGLGWRARSAKVRWPPGSAFWCWLCVRLGRQRFPRPLWLNSLPPCLRYLRFCECNRGVFLRPSRPYECRLSNHAGLRPRRVGFFAVAALKSLFP
jgi:hypothetical protein